MVRTNTATEEGEVGVSASGRKYRVVDEDPEKAARFDERHPNDHDMRLVVRLKDDGTPARRNGYDSTGRYTRVDNTTYKCAKCGVETGTTPGSTSPCGGSE